LRRYVVGVTGASGSLCARSLLCALAGHAEVERVHLALSQFSIQTLNVELGARIKDEAEALTALLGEARGEGSLRGKITLHRTGDMAASISSGSYTTDGMVVVPCSGGTLAAIANGTSANLLHRAAEVTLKERRPLILAFRESPLSLVHAENIVRATRAGAVVFPLTPAFYSAPRGIQEIVEQLTARILDLLHLPHSLGTRWGTDR